MNEYKVHCTGIKVNGMRIEVLRITDDIAIIAQDKINFKRALESLDFILERDYKVEVNRKKQKLRFAPKFLKILILK
jgi:hypothetical protein